MTCLNESQGLSLTKVFFSDLGIHFCIKGYQSFFFLIKPPSFIFIFKDLPSLKVRKLYKNKVVLKTSA